MRSCCSTPRTAVAGARSATSAQAPCRSTKRSSASATIHISWTCARPTVDLLQRIDAKQECRSLETTVFNITHDIRGEARLVERAFGLGASALAEAVQFVSERFELEAA